MTPQERQLVAELFDRLETLEGARRDADAERAIADGFDRAPNSAYALVQTVLVQDEALKRANARIEELEAALSGEPRAPESGGFLDNMRDAFLGRDSARGSVPSVRPGGARRDVWNTGQQSERGYDARADSGYGAPQTGSAPPAFGGGSFLGTAAAGAAGVIGGAMLLNSIRSMFGGQSQGGGASSAFDSDSAGGGKSPWGGDSSSGDLARDAGLGDIGGSRSASLDDSDRRAGLFGGDDADLAGDSDDDFDDDIGGDFDDGGSDTA